MGVLGAVRVLATDVVVLRDDVDGNHDDLTERILGSMPKASAVQGRCPGKQSLIKAHTYLKIFQTNVAATNDVLLLVQQRQSTEEALSVGAIGTNELQQQKRK